MKNRILKDLIIFLLGFILLNWGLSSYYKKVLLKDTALAIIDKQFHDAPSKIKYLGIGDSHLQNAFDSRELPDSFNFSNTSLSYTYIYYRLKYIFDKNIKSVNCVILPLDLHSLSSVYNNFGSNSWYWSQYVDYVELGKMNGDLPKNLFELYRGKFFPYFSSKIFLLRHISLVKKQSNFIGGFVPQGNAVYGEGFQNNTAQRAEYHFKDRIILDHVIEEYFWKTLELCHKYNKQVFLVRTPVTRNYYSMSLKYLKNDPFTKIKERVNDLYPNNVVLLDFAEAFFDKELFFHDADHLNENGAREFMYLLKNQLASFEVENSRL